MRLVDRAHNSIAAVIRPGDTAIDATVGNGTDTLFLAHCVGSSGLVYGFDIQPGAIAVAHNRLREAGLLNRTRLVLGSHADLEEKLASEHRRRIKAVMFNLGYLPRGNKTLTTQPESTRIALESACRNLSAGGRISVLCYTAHPGGQLETERVRDWLISLPEDFRSTVYRPEDTLKAAPELFVIDKA